jgi:hypothetical protein
MQEPLPESESMEFEVKPKFLRMRGKKIGIVALGLAALILVGVVAAAAIRGAPASSGDPLAQVIPSNAVMYFSMTTHPDEQPDFKAVADAWKDIKEAKIVDSALQVALSATGFNWEKDIQPWLGNRAALGIVDFGASSGAGDSARYGMPFVVLAAQTRDRARSDAFLASYRQQRTDKLGGTGGLFRDEVYRGVPIAYFATDSTYTPYGEAYATVNDVVVVTFGPDNLKKVIDAALDKTGLDSSDNFKKTMGALPNPTVGVFYMDYGKYVEAITSMMSRFSEWDTLSRDAVGTTGPSDAAKRLEERRRRQEEQLQQMRQMLQAFGGMGAAMTYEPGGIRFDVAMQMDVSRLPEAWRGIVDLMLLTAPANRVFESIPASAIAAMNMNSPAASLKALLNNPSGLMMPFGDYPGANGEGMAGLMARLQQTTGIDLNADLLDLFNGEFALVMLPQADSSASAGKPALPFVDIAFMFDSSDAARASNSLSKLFEALFQDPKSSRLTVQPLSGLPYTALVSRKGDAVLVYGVVDGRLVIGSSSNALLAIDAADKGALSADASFKSAVAALPANRLSTGYLRPETMWSWIGERLLGTSGQECGVCNYLRPIRWVSFASETFDKTSGLSRGTMHVKLEAPK